LIFYNFHSIPSEHTQFALLNVPYILWSVIVFVQQINNIYEYGNILNIYCAFLGQKQYKSIHFTTSAQYPITYT